jgi:hypothetical protein
MAEVAEEAEEHSGYVGELVTYPPSLKKEGAVSMKDAGKNGT